MKNHFLLKKWVSQNVMSFKDGCLTNTSEDLVPAKFRNPGDLNVLIACEESGVELNLWRELGFNVFACDIQMPSHNDLAHFVLGDIRYLAIWNPGFGVDFTTLDGKLHHVNHWDFILAHPPCTYISRAGVWAHRDDNGEPISLCYEARAFFDFMLHFPGAQYTLVENPTPWKKVLDLPCDFALQPYWFGDRLSKRTCFWSNGLPPFPAQEFKCPKPLDIISVEDLHGSKLRSKTPIQMARALRDFYAEFLICECGVFYYEK